MKELVTQPWQQPHWNPDSHLCGHTCNHSHCLSLTHTYTHADRYIQLPVYCIWMYTASGRTEIQYAWYACVPLWILMNISYLACLVWISRWFLFCLSPVHLDPIHVLAFKKASSLPFFLFMSLYLSLSVQIMVFTHFPGNIWWVWAEEIRSAAQPLPDLHSISFTVNLKWDLC